jgi:hypothetical protein
MGAVCYGSKASAAVAQSRACSRVFQYLKAPSTNRQSQNLRLSAQEPSALRHDSPELAVVLEPVKAWPGNAARIKSYVRRPALIGSFANRRDIFTPEVGSRRPRYQNAADSQAECGNRGRGKAAS